MFFRKAAIRPIPRYAVVDRRVVDEVERMLEGESVSLQNKLDRLFAQLGQKQPAIYSFVSDELGEIPNELAQSLGYFLVAAVHLIFSEAFPNRLEEVDESALALALATLSADEELRALDPLEKLDSDDLIAMNQPAVVEFVQHHVREAYDQADEDAPPIEQLDRVYRAILVQIIALSHAVLSPSGVSGPPSESLH
ncbi:MAG: hypothetical protein GXY23_02350 [Myxococcales bacterium]|nr:hypothetical protein [Myxococcales bacterium]